MEATELRAQNIEIETRHAGSINEMQGLLIANC